MNRKEQEKKELSEYPCPIQDDLETVGVLLSDEIAHYAKEYRMIDPFNPESLGPARYELTVGNEYSRGGNKTEKLYDEPGKNEIRIPPFEVVVIKTNERINLPRFIVARWNIRVKWAYEGLLWVGGPQVDPGWVGHLSCPIYNLSDKEVTVRLGEQIAVMDFVKTTPFKEGKSKEYPCPPKIIFDDYHAEKLKSALYTKAQKRIENIEDKVDRFEPRLDTFIGIIVVAFTVLVAALAIFVSSGQGVYETLPWWTFLCVGFSIIALGMSIFAYTKAGSKKHDALIGNIEERITKLECFTRILIIAIIALTGAVILIWGGVI
jgi:deoxycytidine triphosphate deaminase